MFVWEYELTSVGFVSWDPKDKQQQNGQSGDSSKSEYVVLVDAVIRFWSMCPYIKKSIISFLIQSFGRHVAQCYELISLNNFCVCLTAVAISYLFKGKQLWI